MRESRQRELEEMRRLLDTDERAYIASAGWLGVIFEIREAIFLWGK